jgi:hypothetical protein
VDDFVGAVLDLQGLSAAKLFFRKVSRSCDDYNLALEVQRVDRRRGVAPSALLASTLLSSALLASSLLTSAMLTTAGIRRTASSVRRRGRFRQARRQKNQQGKYQSETK